MAICYKQRKVANKIEHMTVIGDVSGKEWSSSMTCAHPHIDQGRRLMMDHGAKSVAPCAHTQC